MDPNVQIENQTVERIHGPRYERNRKYYLKHTYESLRSTLLHNVKSKGRIPSIATVNKYNLKPEELIKEWRIFRDHKSEVSELKEIKFKVLISNML